jgi:hypothetical protein
MTWAAGCDNRAFVVHIILLLWTPQEIQESEIFKKLDSLEQKMRAHGQNIYTVQECTSSASFVVVRIGYVFDSVFLMSSTRVAVPNDECV